MAKNSTSNSLSVLDKLFEEQRLEARKLAEHFTKQLGDPQMVIPATDESPELMLWHTKAGIVSYRKNKNGLVDPHSQMLVPNAILDLYEKVRKLTVDARFEA